MLEEARAIHKCERWIRATMECEWARRAERMGWQRKAMRRNNWMITRRIVCRPLSRSYTAYMLSNVENVITVVNQINVNCLKCLAMFNLQRRQCGAIASSAPPKMTTQKFHANELISNFCERKTLRHKWLEHIATDSSFIISFWALRAQFPCEGPSNVRHEWSFFHLKWK